MIKKIITFTGLFVFIALLLIIFAPKDKRINEYYINSDQYKELLNSRTINNNISVEIYFDEHKLIEDSTGMLYYSLIEGSSSAFNPRVSVDDYKVAVFGDAISDESIENDKHHNIIVYNNNEYKEYELVCTTLPLLCINTENEVNIAEEDTNGDLFLFDNRENVRQRSIKSKALFHLRGTSSKQYDKKPYKLSLIKEIDKKNNIKNKINLLGLRLSDEYILNAMYIDKEKIREVFSTNLWYESCAQNNSAGINNGYKYEYVELLLNGEYQGLYALGYKPDNEVFNIGPKDWCYRKISSVSSEFEIDLDSTDYVEGYEIKYNHQDYDYWDVLKEYIRMLRTTDNTNYEVLLNSTDINSSIDYYLFINFIQGIDNWIEETNSLNNMYLVYKNNQGRFLYAPWDLDRTWGMNRTDIDYFDDPSVNIISKATAADILLKYSDSYKENFKSRYYELRKNDWSNESITKTIKKYENEIFNSGAFSRDYGKWANHDMSVHANKDEKLSSFLEYVLKRLEYMDDYINSI